MKPSLANLSAVSAAILLSATFAFAGGGEDQAVLKSETSTYQCDILNERGVSVLSEGPAVITESVNLWKAGVNSVSVTLNEKSVIAELKSANAADKDASGIGVLVSVSTDRNSPLTLDLRPFKIKLVCEVKAARLIDALESLTKD